MFKMNQADILYVVASVLFNLVNAWFMMFKCPQIAENYRSTIEIPRDKINVLQYRHFLVEAVKSSIQYPFRYLLPLYGVVSFLHCIFSLGIQFIPGSESYGFKSILVYFGVVCIRMESILIMTIIVWLLISFKDACVDAAIKRQAAREESQQQGKGKGMSDSGSLLEKLRQDPVSQFAEQSVISSLPIHRGVSYLIVILGVMFMLSQWGMDVRSMATVGGAGTVVVGLAAQAALADVLAGIGLGFSRAIVKGDSVVVKTITGAELARGLVEDIGVQRTLLRTDNDVLATVPNHVLQNYCIENLSRSGKGEIDEYGQATQLIEDFVLDKAALANMEALIESVQVYLSKSADLDQTDPNEAVFQGFQHGGGLVVRVKAHVLREAGKKLAQTRQRLLLGVAREMMQQGATIIG